MAGFFLKPSTRGHSRSISLPTRSHPTTLKIEEELNKLRNLEFSNSSTSLENNRLGIAISGLTELYKSIGDLLKLPQTQIALSKHEDSSWVDELLEESVSFLDLCESTRENLFFLRERIGKLQSSLRRRNNGWESDIEDDISKYESFVKTLKRDMSKSLVSLKQIDIKLSDSLLCDKVNNDQYLVAVVRVIRETSIICSIIFRSILGYFLGTNLQPKASKWSLVLKLVHTKGHGDGSNDLEDVEIALNSLMVRKLSKERTTMMIQNACGKLHALDTKTQELEKGLECLFRRLIHTRVSLLNILSGSLN
ncbi:CRISPR-associated endonuclease Cas6f/Csy4 [Bienertia sinuspersici]